MSQPCGVIGWTLDDKANQVRAVNRRDAIGSAPVLAWVDGVGDTVLVKRPLSADKVGILSAMTSRGRVVDLARDWDATVAATDAGVARIHLLKKMQAPPEAPSRHL